MTRICKRCEKPRHESMFAIRENKYKPKHQACPEHPTKTTYINKVCNVCLAAEAKEYWRKKHGVTPCPCCGKLTRPKQSV